MATQKQIEANRRNSQKSTGPRTENGKDRVGQNARKNKAYERETLLPGEKPHNLDALVEAYERRFNPQDPIESDLVFQLAATQYRMRRALRFETSIFDARVNTKLDRQARYGDPFELDKTVTIDASQGNTLSKLPLYENRLSRRYEQTFKQLERIQSRSKEAQKNIETNPIVEHDMDNLFIVD